MLARTGFGDSARPTGPARPGRRVARPRQARAALVPSLIPAGYDLPTLTPDLLDAIVDTVGAVVVVTDRDGRIVRFNRAAEEVSGYRADEVSGAHALGLVVPDEQCERVREVIERLMAGEFPIDHENDWGGRNGRRRIAWRNTAVMVDGRVELVVSTGIDVTDARRAAAAMAAVEVVGDLLATEGPTPSVLRRTLEELASRFGYRYLSIYLMESDGLHLGAQIGYSTPVPYFDGTRGVAGRVIRSRERQFIADTSLDPDYVSADEHVKSEICIPLLERGELLGILNIEADDPPLDEQDLVLIQAVADRLSGSIALGIKVRQLETQAFHDPLTGLANRALFLDRLQHALLRSGRKHDGIGVLFLDVDDFKNVNDALGHAAGDELLRQVGARLCASVRADDTVARLGGDEFAILLESVDGVADASRVTDRILVALGTPFLIGGRQTSIAASVGIVVTEHGGDRAAGDLLRDADIAMYHAKASGKGIASVFEPPMRAAAIARLELDRDLRVAIERNDLFLVYQPIVDVATERIVAAEALVRWSHPTQGLLGPATFMTTAEQNGLIVPLGRELLKHACHQAEAWLDAGLPELGVSFNLSPRQLMDPALIDHVRTALEESGLRAERLTVEITEDVLVTDLERAARVLGALRQLGVRVAIDDFGTGYSSLSYIRELPIDVLKVDRAFISGLSPTATGPREAVVGTLFQLGRLLRVDTVAEGVETREEFEAVRTLGADRAQGFLFARPASPEDLVRLVRAQGAAAGS